MRFFATLRMTLAEGPRMTLAEGLRMTLAEGLRMTLAEGLRMTSRRTRNDKYRFFLFVSNFNRALTNEQG
ncbi:MAG: hypothetical protein CVU77_08715 [Elusimicrobia bacterium HGW-Elusimicrobia-1]|nr:MAG: hypothetical protein CVU77_08715 [Elusimicrobia bacterium HGW-Elusimicrobia-1]